MTKEVAKKIVRGITDKIECNTVDIDDWAEFWGFTKEEYEEFLDMVIKVLEQQPSEDCISRQTVLRRIKESREGIDWGQSEDEDAFLHYSAALYRTIASKECLPSVTPQPKMGRWITTRTFMHDGEFYCDKCKCDSPNNEKWDYCPNCGAKMEVEE